MIRLLLLLFLSTFSGVCLYPQGFRSEQKKYKRVREAFQEKLGSIQKNLESKNISTDELELYIRIFKADRLVEVYGKNKPDNSYQLISSYPICALSGELGPKRKQGDYQIPEGFYHINVFNPVSNFHLSLGINYPNQSDRILGVKNKLGGDIYIHGNCVTIGCVPITDDKIKELYVYCVEAKNNGQKNIPVTIFPTKMTTENTNLLEQKYNHNDEFIGLWEDLEMAYDIFNSEKRLPSITFLPNGRHWVK